MPFAWNKIRRPIQTLPIKPESKMIIDIPEPEESKMIIDIPTIEDATMLIDSPTAEESASEQGEVTIRQ